ncbi:MULTISPECIES: hypothetical protein [Enterococcus]|uniref:hypothetical protein n=1 Tax=Enterococcus TaxID=1350 RepID=UPI000F80EC3C|nr:hypothetical protein [Enterococcus faecalis]MDT2211275.1 hypothetical protein [Enterococcus faecalis]MDV7735050.1 hypothetical protein [Enterococcus faecalis]RTK09416.1 hypothetical protein DRJ95_14745 [Enterococcus faecalis]RTK19923.1 hypothetical protein DRJ93_15135 [Enterococcus faecalis]RTK82221.1 hypothetical protein DRJ71_14365 [Enterococcus faecalis]
MNDENVSIAFQNYLLRKMNEKQSSPLTEYNRGAIAMLLEMQDVYQQLLNNQTVTISKDDEE